MTVTAAASIQQQQHFWSLFLYDALPTLFSFANLGGVLEELNNQFGKIFRHICRRLSGGSQGDFFTFDRCMKPVAGTLTDLYKNYTNDRSCNYKTILSSTTHKTIVLCVKTTCKVWRFLFWFPKSADSMEKSLNIFRHEYLGIFGIFANNSAFF